MSTDREVTAWVYGCTDIGVVRANNEDAFVIADLDAGVAVGSHAPPTAPPSGAKPMERGDHGMFRKCIVGDQGLLLAVSDGMGGAEAGEIASFLVVESLRRDLESAPRDRPTASLIREAVERANHAVWGEAEASPQRSGMGATLTAVLVRGDRVYIAGVGDSRCYVIRGKQIFQVTRDQSLVESLVELGHLSRDEAEVSPHRNVILQALGTRPKVAVALARLGARRGDLLLLCSDGLSGKLSAEEMAAFALNGPTLEEACRQMVSAAKERGGEDNITVILAHLSGPGLQQPAEADAVASAIEPIHSFNHAAGAGYAEDEPTTEQIEETIDDETPTGKLKPPPKA
jgi:serine/threonine protein phosphatase PrpC